MAETTKKLQNWAINKIKSEYSNDISLLVAVDGISVNSDGHGKCFDYYIPVTDRGNELSCTFIIDGVGYDLYPRSWERCACTANLDDNAAFLLLNAKTVYSRSTQDTEKFEQYRKQLNENLNNKDFMYRKALEKLDTAMGFYQTLMFEEQFQKALTGLGFIEHYMAVVTFLLNGKVYSWWRAYYDELLQLPAIPNNFAEYHKTMLSVNSVEECRNLAHLLIATTRKFVAAHKPSSVVRAKTPDAGLADWFCEMSLQWNRIYHYCAVGDADSAFGDAIILQSELNAIGSEYGLADVDLLSSFDIANLAAFSARAKEIAERIKGILAANGVRLHNYSNVEEFLKEN